MITDGTSYSFGPVPSRRLGKSLGINNIPAKVCTYSCVYCQVGRTTRLENERRLFYQPDAILQDVKSKVAAAKKASERIDYLAFVPDGEPTLDERLGREIALLKELGIPVAVITNSSLIWREDVQEDLAGADWVSLKIDAVAESRWRRMNRPHKAIPLSRILEGMFAFSRVFTGTLVTETMLVRGGNDGEGCIKEVADFLRTLRPRVAYLSVPTRPPAMSWAAAPDEEALHRACQLVAEKVQRVEYLIGYEGNAFASTGDAEKDLLSITAVHPMRKEAVDALLSRTGASREIVERLVACGDIKEIEYNGHRFYLRSFAERSKNPANQNERNNDT